MATLVKVQDFAEKLVNGQAVDFTTADVKIALVTAAAAVTDAADQTVAGILANEVVGAGYVAGGQSLTNVTVANVAGVTTVDSDNVSWADTAGGFTDARYAVVYSGAVVIAFADLTSDRSNDGVTFNLNVNAAGLFTIS